MKKIEYLVSQLQRISQKVEQIPNLGDWCKETFEACLDEVAYSSAGGYIFPQNRTDLSEPVEIPTFYKNIQVGPQLDLQNEFLSILRAISIESQGDHEMISKNIPGLTGLVSKISGPPLNAHLGSLWVVAPENLKEQARIQVQIAANFIAFSVAACFSLEAIQNLSHPSWDEEVSAENSALNFARHLKNALSCSSVIIWEIDKSKSILRTIVTDGINPRHSDLDMRLGYGIAGKCALLGSPIAVDNMQDNGSLEGTQSLTLEHNFSVKENDLRSGLFLPVTAGIENVAVVAALSKRALHQLVWNRIGLSASGVISRPPR